MLLLPALLIATTSYFPLGPEVSTPELTGESSVQESGAGELTVIAQGSEMGSIPRGATRVKLLELSMSASCDADITIDDIDVTHIGLGDVSDIRGVYVLSDSRRLSRSIALDRRNGVARIRLRKFQVAKCDAANLGVYADFEQDADVAGEHGLFVERPAAIRSSAKRVMLSAESDAISVRTTPRESGVLSVRFLPLNTRLYYNRLQTVARLQLTSDAKDDHLLTSITLTNQGTARDVDLLRLFLETRSGERVSLVAPRMQAKELKLTFVDDFILQRSETKVLLLKAEVRGSITDTVSFTLEEEGDFETELSPFRR